MRVKDQAGESPLLAKCDAFANVRAEALRRADTENTHRRAAMLEIAEYCDEQEQAALHKGK